MKMANRHVRSRLFFFISERYLYVTKKNQPIHRVVSVEGLVFT